jgi:hypothetical protein
MYKAVHLIPSTTKRSEMKINLKIFKLKTNDLVENWPKYMNRYCQKEKTEMIYIHKRFSNLTTNQKKKNKFKTQL